MWSSAYIIQDVNHRASKNPVHLDAGCNCSPEDYMALSLYVWTDRLIVNAQGQKQVIHINLLQYLLTPLLA